MTMRVAVVMSDGHEVGVDPRVALAQDVALVEGVRGHLDGIVYEDGWATGPRWNMQMLSMCGYLGPTSDPLELTVRRMPLGVRNPVELSEQIATLDHAWGGRLRAGFAVGTPAQCAAFGVDPTKAASRLEEGVGLVRGMWSRSELSGVGPNYVFGELRPTMRTFRPEGPPLSLSVADVDDAAVAARLGLGAHVEHGGGAWEQLLVAYDAAVDGALRSHAGHKSPTTTRSVELAFAAASADELSRLAAAGVAQVDVRVREPGDAPADVLARVDELVERAAALRTAQQ